MNQPDAAVLQVYYLTFCVAQRISGASTPIIRSLQLHLQPLVLPIVTRDIINLHINPLNTELNPTCHLLAYFGAYHILHVSGIRVKLS
jgi:hypothetical protein